MSNGAEKIKQEQAELDKKKNPQTGKPFGEEVRTDRDRDRRAKFAELYGRLDDVKAGRMTAEEYQSEIASHKTTSEAASEKTTSQAAGKKTTG